jgi:hypothetical protein
MDEFRHHEYDAEPSHVEDEAPDASIEPDVIDRLAAYGRAPEPEPAYEPERSVMPEYEPETASEPDGSVTPHVELQPELAHVPEPQPEPQPESAIVQGPELSSDPVH